MKKSSIMTLLLALLLMSCAGTPSEVAGVAAQSTGRSTTPPEYETRRDHDPDGIGKFYMGREIAYVMGHQAADWLERPDRAQTELPQEVIRNMKLKSTDVVADIGAGTGYFTFRISPVVSQGRVYAVDIQPEMLAIIRQRIKVWKVKNVVPVKGTIMDPKLPESSIDLILMVDVYHEFSHPYEMTEAMVDSLPTRSAGQG